MKNSVFGLVVFILLLSGATLLRATEPARWVISTQKEFLEGELTGVSVTSDGKLVLAPSFEPLLDAEEAFVYALAIDRSDNLYLGTGNNGKVFRVSPNGQGREWAKLDEAGVHALAVDSLNRIYAGTSPDGKVYRLSEQGRAEVFFSPEEKYIWATLADRQNNLFVATGPRGIIYKVTPQGESSVFYDSKETHIVTLAWDLNGNLLAGSASGGLLFRISPTGTPFVLHDSPLEEIRSVVVDRYGYIYAAGLASDKPAMDKPPSSAPSKAASADPGDLREGEGATLKVAGVEKGKKLEIYRIDRDNLVETIYSSDDELAFDLLIRSDGNLLVATGNKGRILSIDPRRFVTLLVEGTEEQVTRLVERDKRIYAATSNLGKLFQLLPTPAASGTYTSKVLDAHIPSAWGMLQWQVRNPAPAGLKLYTRSGNTESPDQTWSEWSAPYENARGSYIKSPNARYLQWKIEFPGSGRPDAVVTDVNAVEQVSVSYMQRNMAPQLTSITVHAPGVAFAQYPVPNAPGGVSPGGPDRQHIRSLPRAIRELDRQPVMPPPRRVFIPGAHSISWTAKDPNDDELVCSIYYRGQDETNWKLLEKGLQETHYTIDALSFPDGVYFVKVVASDRPSNPDGQALENELVSKPFVITNTSPAVEPAPPQIQGNQVTLKFTARTTASTIYQAEYRVDAGEWKIVFPEDGIADSYLEQYSFTVENLTPGEHSIALRVVDSVGNIGTSKATVSIK